MTFSFFEIVHQSTVPWHLFDGKMSPLLLLPRNKFDDSDMSTAWFFPTCEQLHHSFPFATIFFRRDNRLNRLRPSFSLILPFCILSRCSLLKMISKTLYLGDFNVSYPLENCNAFICVSTQNISALTSLFLSLEYIVRVHSTFRSSVLNL